MPVPAPLRFRDFRLLLAGQTVSRIGNGIYEGTLGLMVFAAGSALAMSAVLIAFVGPQLVLTIKAGILSDTLDRRHLLLAADLLAAAVTAAVTVLAAAGHLGVAALVVLSLGTGTAAALFNPAYGPLLSHTVPPEHLVRANGLDAAAVNGASLTAPALGGWLYAAGGAVWTLAGNCLTFLAAAACSAAMSVSARIDCQTDHEGPAGPPHSGARAAWHYVRQSGWLPPLLSLACLMNLFVLGPFFVILPWRVTSAHLAPATLGLAVSVQAATALLASILVSRAAPVRPGRRFTAMSLAFPAALLVLLLVDDALGVLLAAALVGVGMSSGVLENVMLQSWVPDHLRGRVYSFDVLASLGAIPVGYFLAGIAINVGALRPLGIAGAILCSVVAAATLASRLATHTSSMAATTDTVGASTG